MLQRLETIRSGCLAPVLVPSEKEDRHDSAEFSDYWSR